MTPSPGPRAPISIPHPDPCGIAKTPVHWGAALAGVVFIRHGSGVLRFQSVAPYVALNVAANIKQNQWLNRLVQRCYAISRVASYTCACARAHTGTYAIKYTQFCCSVALRTYPIDNAGKLLQQTVQQSVQRQPKALQMLQQIVPRNWPIPLKTINNGGFNA